MKTVEFQSELTADARLRVPEEIATQIPKDETLRVIVVLPDGEEPNWGRATAEQFLAGYAESDSIYDAI